MFESLTPPSHPSSMPGFNPRTSNEFTFHWTPESMTWSINGVQVFAVDATQTPWFHQVFNKPYYLRVNLAVGGRWPGEPTASTQLPARFALDSIEYTPLS